MKKRLCDASFSRVALCGLSRARGADGERRQGRFAGGCCHGARYPCRRGECGAVRGKQGLGGVGKAAAPNPWQILRPHIEGCGPHVTKGSQMGGGWGVKVKRDSPFHRNEGPGRDLTMSLASSH